MADGGEEAAARPCSAQHSEEYYSLLELGLDSQIAEKLEEIYQTGKLAHSELDDRAIDALKEFPMDGAKAVLQQFLESNLEHVSNKSAFLCGIMKTYRQKVRAMGLSTIGAGAVGGAGASSSGEGLDLKPVGKGPDKDKIKAILERTGYSLDVTTGQRKYGGPPPNWEGSPPPNGCEVFCGKIPRDVYEDELILLFEKCGTIWDLRLMMDPLTGLNRGYAFVTFTTSEAAQEAVRQLNDYEMKGGRRLKVNVSVPNLRLFVGNIPKSKGKAEIKEEFSKVTAGLVEVIIYSSADDRRKNRGFCFLEYDSHKSASLAKRRLGTGRVKIFGCDIIVDWADPQDEPDMETMSKVKVLYCRNLVQDFTEERLKETFEAFGTVQRVKKLKDYAFIHFEEREDAIAAMEALHGKVVHGVAMDISLAKPPSDKKKKEELLRAREKRLFQQHVTHRGGVLPPVPFRGGARGAAGGRGLQFSRDYQYECGYGAYRGGYADPYYNGLYYSGDYYYDYPARGGRGRSSSTFARGGRGGSGGRGGGRPAPSERPSTPPGAQGGPGRWRGSAESGSYPSRGAGSASRGGGAWKGRGGAHAGRSGTRGSSAKSGGRDEASAEISSAGQESSHQGEERRRGGNGGGGGGSGGAEAVAMGTWSSESMPQQQQQGGSSDDTVWYQDSYGASWS